MPVYVREPRKPAKNLRARQTRRARLIHLRRQRLHRGTIDRQRQAERSWQPEVQTAVDLVGALHVRIKGVPSRHACWA